MDTSKQLIIVNEIDKTDSIVSIRFRGSKCDIVFKNSSRVYSYNSNNVRIIKLKQVIDPNTIIFKYKDTIIANIDQVRDFGEFYRVIRYGKKELACRLNGLSSALIQVLKVKSLRGCKVKNWLGFENGNGTDVGQDIERLIKRAEREQKYLLTVKHE